MNDSDAAGGILELEALHRLAKKARLLRHKMEGLSREKFVIILNRMVDDCIQVTTIFEDFANETLTPEAINEQLERRTETNAPLGDRPGPRQQGASGFLP